MTTVRLTGAGRSPDGSATRRRSRGQSLVETALVLPIFLLLLMSLFDIGRVVYAQHTITQDSREASRKGQVSPLYTTDQYAAIRSAALVMSPGVALTAANITGLAGTNCNTVAVTPAPPQDSPTTTCFYPDGITSGNRVVVNITVTVPVITPILSQLIGGNLTVTATSVSYIQ